jgi:transcriptional regulatory protein LevR
MKIGEKTRMDKKLVKNKILLNKVAEYFTKHPKKESVVVRADFGESKVFWRAVREDFNKFAITEVKTVTDSFVFEIAPKSSKTVKS